MTIKSDNNRNYKALLKAGNKAQLIKLKQNGHKKGFEEIDMFYVLAKIIEEVDELRDELCDRSGYGGSVHEPKNIIDYKAAMYEAADIANYAHMVILQCERKIKD